ncbi:MAG: hypothetical protein ACN6N0_03920 [Microvirgula sp.]
MNGSNPDVRQGKETANAKDKLYGIEKLLCNKMASPPEFIIISVALPYRVLDASSIKTIRFHRHMFLPHFHLFYRVPDKAIWLSPRHGSAHRE